MWYLFGFHQAHISTPKGVYNACCHYKRKGLLKRIDIASCQVLILWMSEPVATWQHCSSRSLEPATVGYESYALTNCAITARAFHNRLNIICKGTFIVLDISFSTLGWNPYVPADLETFNLFSFFSTRSGVIIISLSVTLSCCSFIIAMVCVSSLVNTL